MITMTAIAKRKLVNLIEKSGKSAFLYLRGGGCNGFSYKFKILQKDEKPLCKLIGVFIIIAGIKTVK